MEQPGSFSFRAGRLLAVCALVSILAACSTVRTPSPSDPLEGFNRSVDSFNKVLDDNVVRPVAKGYTTVVPEPARNCVSNFFSNLDDIGNALNNLLQGNPLKATSDICRVVFNSTFGLFGLFDVATDMGLEKHDEDFGQTLGKWGVGAGPYVVLPLMGPSTLRDTVGRLADNAVDPVDQHEDVSERNVARGAEVIDLRARLLPATDLVDRVALDRYSFIRDAYLARRQSLIRDGAPDPEDDFEDEDEDDDSQSQQQSRPLR